MIQGLLRSRSLHPACVVRKSIGGRLIALPGIVHVRLIPQRAARDAASPLNFKTLRSGVRTSFNSGHENNPPAQWCIVPVRTLVGPEGRLRRQSLPSLTNQARGRQRLHYRNRSIPGGGSRTLSTNSKYFGSCPSKISFPAPMYARASSWVARSSLSSSKKTCPRRK